MKLFLGVVILILCTIFGYIFSQKYVDRRKFYFDFLSFNKIFRTEIKYGKEPIEKVFSKIEDKKFYQYCICKLNDKEVNSPSFLKQEEVQFLNNYVNFIGKSDSISQENFINSSEGYLQEKYTNSINEEKKYKDLYVKLGFLIGLIFFIAFI